LRAVYGKSRLDGHLDVRWIFWINVPIGMGGVILATFYIEDVKGNSSWPLDVKGFLLSGAEIDASQMSSAVAFSSMAQQLSLSFGIAAAAGALEGVALLIPGHDALGIESFRWAFIAVAAVSLSSALVFMRLPADAGSELTRGPLEKAAEAIPPASQ
jgi:hypothetical protein